jgi:hypothetical protein
MADAAAGFPPSTGGASGPGMMDARCLHASCRVAGGQTRKRLGSSGAKRSNGATRRIRRTEALKQRNSGAASPVISGRGAGGSESGPAGR